MAMVECKECGKSISDRAASCPQCGCPLRRGFPYVPCLFVAAMAGFVVFMLLIIAAIAIPNLLRSRMHSNESAAIGNLRTIVGAEVAYHAANHQYTAVFGDLTNATPAFLDGDWSVPRSGYTFTLGGNANNFTANADPVTMGTTGGKGFYTDSTGVIRYALEAVAGPDSPAIGE